MGRTSGSQSASLSFALAAGNTNPQGIADPPVDSDALLLPIDASPAPLPVFTKDLPKEEEAEEVVPDWLKPDEPQDAGLAESSIDWSAFAGIFEEDLFASQPGRRKAYSGR